MAGGHRPSTRRGRLGSKKMKTGITSNCKDELSQTPMNKAPKLKHVIQISSSQQESLKWTSNGAENTAQNEFTKETKTNDEVVLARVDLLGSAVEEVKQVVHNLAAIFANHNPIQTTPLLTQFHKHVLGNSGPTRTTLDLTNNSFMTPAKSASTKSTKIGQMAIAGLTDCSKIHSKPVTKSVKRQNTRVSKEPVNPEKEGGKETNASMGNKGFNPRKIIFTPDTKFKGMLSPNHDGYYIVSQAQQSSIALHDPPRTSGIELPSWVPLLFRPTKVMKLNEVEVAVCAYIFVDNKYNDKEIIATNGLCHGHRDAFTTLVPKGMVDNEILNLMACMLTHQERARSRLSSIWFLPTTFSQFGLSWSTHPASVVDHFHPYFMGKVEYLRLVCVPINEGNMHWYLLVVDFFRKQLVLLDSMPTPSNHSSRMRSVKMLGLFLEEMLLDKRFYEHHSTEKPNISAFQFFEPKGVQTQRVDSNDCGIFVATWMMQAFNSDYYGDYYNIHVQDETRMRVALDLVLDPYNHHKDNITRLAFQHLKNIQTKNKRLHTS